MPQQTTCRIAMVRPARFAFNAQTAVNNAFQSQNVDDAQPQALQEFDGFVALLRAHGVEVIVVDDTSAPHTPDSIFPNNWISFHASSTVVLYPMFAANRRPERQKKLRTWVEEVYKPKTTIDYTAYEDTDRFLEGTGSMVLDRVNKIAYACISPRTDRKLLQRFCDDLDFTTCVFDAADEKGNAVYHTNVLMCVAETFVVICLEAISNGQEREAVTSVIANTNKKIVEISFTQMNSFAGNMLQVKNQAGERFLVMSSQAFGSLTSSQIEYLQSQNGIVYAPLNTIEKNGGGSARCMMAEIF